MNVERVPWSGQVADGLGSAVKDDGATIAGEVKAGYAEAWRFGDGKAYAVTRIEQTIERRELVIVCVAGERLDELAQMFYRAAVNMRCDSVRWHNDRPAIQRLVERARLPDFRVLETVYRMDVNHGR